MGWPWENGSGGVGKGVGASKRQVTAHFQQGSTHMAASSRPDLTGMLIAGGTAERKALTLIQDALRKHRGNLTWTADELNVSIRTLRRWVAKHQPLRTMAHRARLLPPMQSVQSSATDVIAETSTDDAMTG